MYQVSIGLFIFLTLNQFFLSISQSHHHHHHLPQSVRSLHNHDDHTDDLMRGQMRFDPFSRKPSPSLDMKSRIVSGRRGSMIESNEHQLRKNSKEYSSKEFPPPLPSPSSAVVMAERRVARENQHQKVVSNIQMTGIEGKSEQEEEQGVGDREQKFQEQIFQEERKRQEQKFQEGRKFQEGNDFSDLKSLPSEKTSETEIIHSEESRVDDPRTGSSSPSQDHMLADSTHHGGGHGGWLDMGAYSGKKGAFGWYADFPVGYG